MGAAAERWERVLNTEPRPSPPSTPCPNHLQEGRLQERWRGAGHGQAGIRAVRIHNHKIQIQIQIRVIERVG